MNVSHLLRIQRNYSGTPQCSSHHPAVDDFPTSAHHQVLYSIVPPPKISLSHHVREKLPGSVNASFVKMCKHFHFLVFLCLLHGAHTGDSFPQCPSVSSTSTRFYYLFTVNRASSGLILGNSCYYGNDHRISERVRSF